VGLAVLAPLVGEYLLGNISIRHVLWLPFLVPLYGAGALLIRECARRANRGWPAIVVLGLAYGIIEAGLVDQSMFNPSFMDVTQDTATRIDVLGISAGDALTYLAGHAVWSISVPIALVEAIAPGRSTVPWLGRTGLALTAALYGLGCWIIFDDVRASEGYLASPAQLAGAGAAAVALIGIAFGAGRRAGPPSPPGMRASPVRARWRIASVPSPRVTGIAGFAGSTAFILRPEAWAGVAVGLAVLIAAAGMVHHWSRQERWSASHELALAGGILLTYAWLGFVLTAMFEPGDPVRWIGNVVFAAAAAVLVLVIAKRAPTGSAYRGRHPSGIAEL
jgi:hypothetical protein